MSKRPTYKKLCEAQNLRDELPKIIKAKDEEITRSEKMIEDLKKQADEWTEKDAKVSVLSRPPARRILLTMELEEGQG